MRWGKKRCRPIDKFLIYLSISSFSCSTFSFWRFLYSFFFSLLAGWEAENSCFRQPCPCVQLVFPTQSRTPHQVKCSPIKAVSPSLMANWSRCGCSLPGPTVFSCVRHCAEWPQVLRSVLRLDSLLHSAFSSPCFRLFTWVNKFFLSAGKNLGMQNLTGIFLKLHRFDLNLKKGLVVVS